MFSFLPRRRNVLRVLDACEKGRLLLSHLGVSFEHELLEDRDDCDASNSDPFFAKKDTRVHGLGQRGQSGYVSMPGVLCLGGEF